MNQAFTPRKYGKLITDHVLDVDRPGVWAGMGLGKTVSTLNAMNDLQLIDSRPQLVIAPLRVARSTWPEEIKEWKQAAGITYTLIRAEDSDDDIKAIYKEAYDVHYAAERRVGETPRVAARNAARKASPIWRSASGCVV